MFEEEKHTSCTRLFSALVCIATLPPPPSHPTRRQTCAESSSFTINGWEYDFAGGWNERWLPFLPFMIANLVKCKWKQPRCSKQLSTTLKPSPRKMFLIEIWPRHCCVECSCREIWDNKILLKIVTAQSCCLACAGARIRGNTTGWHLGIHPSTHYTIHTLVTGYISSKLNQFLIIPKKISCINLHHQEILTLWCSTNDSRVSRQSDSHTWSLLYYQCD